MGAVDPRSVSKVGGAMTADERHEWYDRVITVLCTITLIYWLAGGW